MTGMDESKEMLKEQGELRLNWLRFWSAAPTCRARALRP